MAHQVVPQGRDYLSALGSDIHLMIFDLLPKVPSTCLALTSKYFLATHQRIHGNVPLSKMAIQVHTTSNPGEPQNQIYRLHHLLRGWSFNHGNYIWGGKYGIMTFISYENAKGEERKIQAMKTDLKSAQEKYDAALEKKTVVESDKYLWSKPGSVQKLRRVKGSLAEAEELLESIKAKIIAHEKHLAADVEDRRALQRLGQQAIEV